MKKRALQIALIGLLIGVAFFFRGRDRLPETPEATVNALFDAAEAGDAAAYLRLVEGKLKAESLAVKNQVGARQFGEDLRSWAAGIENFGITRQDDPAPDQVALEVKITFADRDEIQRWVLVAQADGWVVTSMDTAVTQEQEIPFGTPVFGTPDQE
ncbi:MAG: hypothetical protein HQ581_19650 [Planctomycetes bacterium]|nr:hypothetical protein [Planctomycetota bacterium]